MTMTLIQTITVGAGGAASIEFTGIPQTGTDLLVLLSSRSGNDNNLAMRFNSDSANNYSWRTLRGYSSSVDSTNQAAIGYVLGYAGSTDTASTFSNASFYIPSYTSSSAKSVSVDHVGEANNAFPLRMISAARWSGTAAITSIAITDTGAVNFAQYSTASLYLVTKGSGGASVS